MSTGNPPLDKVVRAGWRSASRLPIRPPARRTDNSGAVSRLRQVRFAKFRRSATPFILQGRRADSVAGKKERQRRLAREHYERQQARRVHRSRRWRTWGIIALACCTAIGLGTGAYFLLQGGGKPASAASASPRPTGTASGTAAAPAEPTTHCTYAASPPAARTVGVPPATPDSKATYRATIVTNRGDVVIDLG